MGRAESLRVDSSVISKGLVSSLRGVLCSESEGVEVKSRKVIQPSRFRQGRSKYRSKLFSFTVTFHGSVQMLGVKMIGVHFRRLHSRLYIYACERRGRIKEMQ